ncbi:hypothetical protein OA958_04940 [Bacteroidota bacterium]|nr:hypothetical protein [Bacteroidota bacterium]
MKANEINKKVAYSLTITELKGYLNYMIEHSPNNLKAVLRPDNSVTIEVSEFINSGEAHIIPIYDLLDNVDMDYYSVLHTKNEA